MALFSYLYHKVLIHRYDDDHIIKYFSVKDFPGLVEEPIEFNTPSKETLKGAIYYYPNYKKDKLIVFSHGLFGGYLSYMREIEHMAKHGYRVVAYNNMGCFSSSGKDIHSINEGINDLESCLNYLKDNKYLDNIELHIVGHSWGGYAAGCILRYFKDIKTITILSGFVSPKRFVENFIKVKDVILNNFETKANPRYKNANIVDSLKEHGDTQVLYIQSKDDRMVPLNCGMVYVMKHVKDDPNITYLLVDKKRHVPQYKVEAVSYMEKALGDYNKLVRKKTLKTVEEKQAYIAKIDFMKMTEQDDEIWDVIYKHIG